MKNKWCILSIIALAGCFPAIGSDIYAPSLPFIANDLNTHIDLVQWSMAIYMLGLAITQLIYGPLSEGIGRRYTLIASLCVVFTGCLISVFAPSISMLICGRFIQGCGAGGSAALWRAIFRDSFEGAELAKYVSYLSIFIIFIVPAAPTLGGYLQTLFGWRSNFVFLSSYSVIAIIVIFVFLKETNKHMDITRLNPKFIIDTYKTILFSRLFMGYCLSVFFSYGAFFSWFVISPVLLIKTVGMTPISYGWISFLGVGLAMLLSSLINGKIVGRFGSHLMLRLGWSIMIIAGILMLTLKFLFGINAMIIVLPTFLLIFGVTFIWPNAFTSAFAPFGKIAGYAAAIYGAIQLGGAAVMGSIISFLPDSNQLPLAIIFILSPLLAWLVFEIVIQPIST